MKLAAPLALLLLALVPLVLLLQYQQERARQRRESDAGDRQLLAGLCEGDPDGGHTVRWWRAILLAASIAFFAVALARPQFGMRTERHKARGIDLVVALDLSKSMLARDVVPSRLARAKLELGALVDQLRGDRIGLVGFTSIALPLCPLTIDHAAFKLQLKDANPGDLPRGGTDISDAIKAGKRMLESGKSSAAAQAMLIITDGEDNEGDAAAAAKEARAAGIEVHVVGVGSRTGEPIPILKDDGQIDGYLKDASGKTVVSRLNESVLRRVADEGGGLVALPGDVGGLDLSPVRGHLETLKKAELQERTIRVYEERYQWALAPGFLLLLAATVLRPTRRPVRVIRRGGARSLRAAALLSAVLLPGRAQAGPLEREDPDVKRGNSAAAAGRAKEALDDYARAQQRLGEDPRILFDRGLAQAKAGELDKAIGDLKMAMENADAPSLRAESAFALGNTYRKLKKWDEAIGAYRRALVEDPGLSGARRNLEITERLKAIAALQPHDQNQNKDQKNDQPPPDRDGGASPDAGAEDGGGDGGDRDAGTGGDSGSGADGQGGADGGDQSDKSSADGGAGSDGSSSSNAATDAGAAQDSGGAAGAAPRDQEKAEPKDDEKQAAQQLLDALQEQEKALKRRRLQEKYRHKQVEKDW